MPVEKQHRWARAAVPHAENGLSDVHTLEIEPVEHGSILSAPMARKRSWLQEERRRTLGDWVALCLGCGHVQRYFEDTESALAATCPQCGQPLLHRCPECSSRIASAFAVECEECGAALRPDQGFGSRIRKPGR
jgi:ribosomal protein S27E